MKYTANEYPSMSSGLPGSGSLDGARQSGGNWSPRPEGDAQRAFAVSAAPAGNQPMANQPMANQPMANPGQFSSAYTTGGPSSGGLAGGGPSANGTSRAALGTLIVRPLPSEEGTPAREVVLDGRDVAIGRSPACDVVLEGDQLVSRRHALLRSNGTQYTIVDLGSSNGTYVNDVEIHQTAALNDGDLITIGEREMVYSTRPPSGVAGTSGTLVGAIGAPQESRAPTETAPYPAPGSVAGSQLFDVSAAQTLLEPPVGTQPPAQAAAEPNWAPSAPPQSQAAPVQPQYQPQYQAQPPNQFPAQAPYQPQYQSPAQQPSQQVVQQVAQQPPQYQPTAQPAQGQPPYQPFQPQVSQPAVSEETAYAPIARSPSTTNVRNTSTYLRAARAQLDEANQRLAQAEEEESRLVEQRRAGMIEVRDRLNAILAEQRRAGGYGGSTYAEPAGTANNPNTAALINLARQTEQNPRQIDFMMQLASRAGEIATALEGAQAPRPAAPSGGAPEALLAQLEALKARLDELTS